MWGGVGSSSPIIGESRTSRYIYREFRPALTVGVLKGWVLRQVLHAHSLS